MLNKEVKVILNLVRMKGKSLRPKLASILTTALISGLLVSIPVPANAAACNPTITTATNGDKILTFTTVGNCDWTVPAGVGTVQIVAVGGGGASGQGVSGQWWGAGGGGGQVTSQTISVTAGNTIAISVGAGGNAGDGGSSTFGVISAAGGKAPINTDRRGGVSGSNQAGGLSGLTGVASGGGGGADTAGSGMNAGAGITSSITGTAIEYGGGGTGYNGASSGTQRVGAGRYNVAPTANRGGGASWMATGRGVGGSGVVVVRYVPTCSPTSTTTDSDYVFTFTNVGKCAWSTPAGVSSVNVLIVAGGGGGGDSDSLNYRTGGTGGAGGYFSGTNVSISGVIDITVGAGGAGAVSTTTQASAGEDSAFGTLKVGGGGGGNSWNYTLGAAAGSGRGDSTYLTGGNGGGARSRTSAQSAQPGGAAGSYASNGIAFLSSTITGAAGVAGGNGNSSDAGTGGTGGSITESSRTSSISGSSVVYAKPGTFGSWSAGAQTYGSGGDTKYAGGTNDGSTTGSAGAQGVVIVSYVRAAASISYNVNGGNASAPTTQTQSLPSDLLTLATYAGTKSSLRFMNWNTAADGSGTNYAAGEAVRPLVNMTLYAQWMGAYCPEGWTWTEPVCSKSYTGVQNFIIPWGFRSLDVIALGGSGGAGAKGASGAPGKAHASYAFTQGDNIRFYPGAAGSGINGGADSYPNENYNGGVGLTNNGGSGGGGAATVVTKNGTATSTIIIVAGGGGGGGASSGCGSSFNQESAAGVTTVSSNGLTYGSSGINHGYNRFSGGGGGGTNGGNGGTATAAYSCGSGNDQGGHGRGGFRGGNTISGAAATVLNGANINGGAAGSVTLQLTRPKITYNLNGGTGTTPSNQIQTSEGEDLRITSTVPVRTGYTFGGWNTLAAGTGTNYLADAIYNTNAVLNLFAKWTANSYNVIYDTSTVTSGTMANTALTAGTAFTLRANAFARVGHTFKNWNTAANGSGTTYTNSQSVTLFSDLTLYPQWNLIAPGAPTVTTEAGNTEVTVTPTAAAASGTTVGPTTSMLVRTYNSSGVALNPAKTCAVVSPATSCVITGLTNGTTYQFDATATNATATSAGSTKVNGIPAGVVITYNATSNSGALTTFTITNRVLTSQVATLTTSTPHEFTVGTSVVITMASDTRYAGTRVITAVPTPTSFSYALSLVNLASTSVSDGTVTWLSNPTFNKGAPLIHPSATKTGNTFAGWYTASTDGTLIGGAGGNYSPNMSASIVNRSLTSNVATLTTSSPHGFVVGMSVIVVNINSTFNGTYTVASVPTSTTFTYAKTATDVTAAAVSPAGRATLSALTLYAQFVGNTFAISYNGNGNTGGTIPANGSYQAGGSSYTILGGTNSPAKVGYTFDGWYTNSTGTGGTSYAVGASYNTTSNLNLFAKWTAATRTVTYALDGGTSTATTTTLTGRVVGNTVTLPAANTMSKTGFVFAGWSDGTTSYAGGATWTVPASDNNFTLTAQWTTQTLSYSYDTNGGGTAPAGGTKTYGQSLVLEPSTGLSKTGYTFAGWNDGSTTHLAGATITLTASKVFVAQWSAQSYSITYDGNGSTSGSVTAGSYVADGVPYAIAANGFTKTGYTFAGWKDATNTSFIVGAGYSTAANLVLTAQWTASTYTVTYNGNGSTGGTVPSNGTLTTGVTFNAAANAGTLAKTGYTFTGWNTNAAGTGTNVAENGVLTTTSNIVLYAKWAIVSPTITFNKGAASTTPSVFPSNTSAQYGSVFTLPATDTSTVISSVTQIFTGWNDGTNTYASGDTYRVGINNITFTAQWIAVYTVRYVLNGGTGAVPADVLRIDQFAETLTSATVTKAGFTLSGWKDQSGVNIPAASNSWIISSTSYVAYAQWTATQRTLSFDESGGSTTQASITGKVIGELVALPIPTFTKTGYTFGGWSNSGTTYPAGGTFVVGDANAAFVAVWIGNTNTITYNGNGATGGTAPGNGSYVSGNSTPYTVSSNSGTLVKAGFTFDNWYTTATGSSGTAYTAGTGTLTTTSDLILYAKWSAASYTVSYASGDNAVSAPSQSTNAYGSSFTLPNALTRTGYTFLGWELGSGASANLYAPAATFTMGSSAITFTAKWSALSYVIVYSLNGGSGSTPTQANVEHNLGFTTAPAPTRSGFTFAGWSDGAATINASTSISNVTSNRTLTAQWTIAVPGVPGTPTATPGNGSATITITPPSSGGTPSSYTITASPGGATCTVTAPGTSCTISPLTNGTPYTFTSTATNATGTSASSSSASTAVTPASAPSAPLGVAGSGTGGSSTITWSAPSDNGGSAVTDYIVEYRVATSGTWTTFTDGVSTTTSATVTGLSAGSAYEFRVTAKNLIGNSLASFTSPVVETLPAAPSITGVTAASGQVSVAWNAPTHLGSGTLSGDQYIVTAYDSQGNQAGTCEPTSGQTTCVVTGLANGSAYTFKVEAITTVGTSEQSSASAAATPSGTPSAPADVVAVNSGSNMTVTFTAPADNGGAAITSYVITSTPSGATCTVGANATTYTCTGLTAGANYTYTVKAVNVRGESTASQASTAVIAIAVPSAPQNVKAVITAGSTTLSATVSFDPPATENGSAVISYTVTASPGGATCTVTAPDLYCEIPVLPDSLYTFTARATNAVGTSVASVTSLQTAAANGIAPSLVVDPAPAPTGTLEEGSTLTSTAVYVATPNAVVTYVWKRCTDQFDNTTCTTISGASSSTYILTSADVDKFIRVQTTGTNSIGTSPNLSDATEAIIAAPVAPTPSTPSTPSNPSTPAPEPSPAPVTPSCDSSCQAIKDAAAAKAAADAAAKAAADKAAADAASKLKADADARTASDKASAAAKAAADAAKTAVDRAGAAAAAKAAADAAANAAAAQAKAASDAQAAANKAAADAAAALRNGSASAAAKAAATAAANKAAADAAAAVKAAATAAQNAAKAKSAETNANKQVEIAINSLTSRTAAAQATAEANAIAAAAKAAANEAAAAAATRANEARAAATAAQKAASDAAARIAVEQKEAASAAAAAKAATAAAAKASAEKIAATNAAKTAAENLAKVLNEKAALAEQAANATDAKAREEIAKKIEEIETKVDEVEAAVEETQDAAEEATAEYEEASVAAEEAQTVAAEEAQDAVEIKTEVATKTAAATKAAATATVAAKVATAAKAAAAKVPSKAVITKKPSTTSKNGAKATVTGLKPGQKVKVTVNVKPKP
jgi:uncharacterized repeat protein (TIGR02543 family)